MSASNFNPIWEDSIYGTGNHLNKYPFDNVVTFIFRNFPRNKPRNEIKILEIGSGAGNNLWFAAREGFSVTGIDGSKSAIDFAKKRFEEEGLKGEFLVGDFTNLPLKDDSFDIVIDRGSIVCVGLEAGKKAIQEAHRTLVKGGLFFFNPYSQAHTSFSSGTLQKNGQVTDIEHGMLVGVGAISLYSHRDILDALPCEKWNIKTLKHKEVKEIGIYQTVHAEWEVITQKI
ncbi:methylase involved in ubiquinone/menaquinone biosynthesis [Bernardetia litoralis DSM 6794]|uniref:Methylase involved in ubiquinone/menaquinone biosynthesis n=1 Tax=Bernardetia litoralis (strain ATCC 23117 / DSM 6794 / NBRC 15988 / NCIMB 1366 / Fx l1 / Sio-4) TaxID=880071 RepID=I4APG7_BERLS|nr:class I SAM-dependent methyltransferase [Bernardetia litoralis]AFM05852.1 methylase involved in ubiquinone/menaquinone biosynthesis [Bernardetia litoralis DSM 6794]